MLDLGLECTLAPTTGLPRNVAAPCNVDKLFPQKGDTGRIPIIATSGTNGKTTTTRLIAHIAKMKGYRVGYTTSDGVYIQNRLLMTGDCTGPASTEFVLKRSNGELCCTRMCKRWFIKSWPWI